MAMFTDNLGSQMHAVVEDPEDLIQISSGIIASPIVSLDLETAHQKGEDLFVTFSKHRLQGIARSIPWKSLVSG